MAGYPVILDLTRLPTLVVGGGRVAGRKLEGLLAGGATPDVLSPQLSPSVAGVVAAFGLRHRAKPFAAGDAHGYRLVVAATDERDVNAAVAAEAGMNGAWVNVVDDPDASNFSVPAVLRRSEVVAAISTGGASPLLAAAIKDRLGEIVTPGLGRAVARLQAVRQEVRSRWPEDEERRRAFWKALVTEEFLDCAISGKDEEVESRIAACLSQS